MYVSPPSTSLATTTPLQDATPGAVGTSAAAAHGDHQHPSLFQNATDSGKRYQRVLSASVTTTVAAGGNFFNSWSASWPATFAGTPNAQMTVIRGAGKTTIGGVVDPSPTTTSISGLITGAVNTDTGQAECWGIG